MDEFSKTWNSFSESQRSYFCYKIWNSCSELQKSDLWNILADSGKIELWKKFINPQKVEFWDILKDNKLYLWNILEDSQKEESWNILTNPQKKELWNFLKDSQKADFLEILSRNYSLAQIVYAVRKIIEKRLKRETHFKKHNFNNVYISLEYLLSPVGNKQVKQAFIDGDILSYRENNNSLYLNINYDIGGGIVEYDNEHRISKKCARFLVGHEIGHIFLHLENIIKDIIDNKEPSKSPKEEKEADFFAQIISDLRDLYILKHPGNKLLQGKIPSNESIMELYKKENILSEEKIDSILSLNKESEKFTMSSYVFATKKIMNEVYGHKISEIYSRIKDDEKSSTIRIERFQPTKDSFGYSIEIPQSPDVAKNSYDTAKGIGALLLNYDKIKNEKLILVDKKNFSMETIERINKFSECLLKVRENYLRDFCQKIKSKIRLIPSP